MVEKGEAQIVFDGPHDVQRWDVRARRSDVVIVRRRFREPPEPEEAPAESPEGETAKAPPATASAPASGSLPGERYVILAIERGGKAMPMSMALVPRRGDEATVAIHKPDHEEALRLLEAAGWWEIPQMVEEDASREARAVE
jgi:hypothetical protein